MGFVEGVVVRGKEGRNEEREGGQREREGDLTVSHIKRSKRERRNRVYSRQTFRLSYFTGKRN